MTYRQKKVSAAVFRAYDIRGIVGQDLDEDAFYSIGLALAYTLDSLQQRRIFLGRDGRLTSPALALALQQGLLDSGITVLDLGAITTPLLYYATYTQPTNSGLMVTGSHNPAPYNGIKIVLDGKTQQQEGIQALHDLVVSGTRLYGQGTVHPTAMLPAYTQRILSDIVMHKPLKVVVDCGNGIAGLTVPTLLHQLGCEVIPLYCDVDGHFPNHHPDPSLEANLADLKKAVIAHSADVGLAFDGDADRLGLVTEQGEMVMPDRLMMLYARTLLAKIPGASIVYDVKCSSALEQVIHAAGGVAIMCPTGHSKIKAMMQAEGTVFGGEMSGHLFFKDRWYGFDDALYSACRLLEILSADSLTVSEQFATIPQSVSTPELFIAMADAKKFLFMERFTTTASFPNARLITMDGVRAQFPKGWGLLRASNTSPCLVARFEADDAAHLEAIQQLFKQAIHRLDTHLDLPF